MLSIYMYIANSNTEYKLKFLDNYISNYSIRVDRY